MVDNFVLVTAPNSKTGKQVVKLLEKENIPFRAASRSTSPSFDWEDEKTWSPAMSGTNAIYAVIPPNLAFADMPVRFKTFLKHCEAEQIKRIVLLSGRGEEEASRIEDIALSSTIPTTVLRASWFAQNFSEGYFVEGVANGLLALPSKLVREPFIDTRDIAKAAAFALKDTSSNDNIYELTGPELLSFEDVANKFTKHLDQPVTFVYVPLEDYLNELQQFGVPSDEIELTRFLFDELLDGRNAYTTSDLNLLLGEQGTSFEQFIQHTKSSGVWQPECQ